MYKGPNSSQLQFLKLFIIILFSHERASYLEDPITAITITRMHPLTIQVNRLLTPVSGCGVGRSFRCHIFYFLVLCLNSSSPRTAPQRKPCAKSSTAPKPKLWRSVGVGGGHAICGSSSASPLRCCLHRFAGQELAAHGLCATVHTHP